jgi:hypothetical protein
MTSAALAFGMIASHRRDRGSTPMLATPKRIAKPPW